MTQVPGDDFGKPAKPVNVEWRHASIEVHCEKETHQSQVVVAVEVTYKNVIDAMMAQVHLVQLHLCSFPAVDQEVPVLDHQLLRRGEPAESRNSATGSEYRELKGHGRESVGSRQ